MNVTAALWRQLQERTRPVLRFPLPGCLRERSGAGFLCLSIHFNDGTTGSEHRSRVLPPRDVDAFSKEFGTAGHLTRTRPPDKSDPEAID